MEQAGLDQVAMGARYECYPSLALIGEYLALQLDRAGQVDNARALRVWAGTPSGMFAQAWVWATGRKPPDACQPVHSEIS